MIKILFSNCYKDLREMFLIKKSFPKITTKDDKILFNWKEKIISITDLAIFTKIEIHKKGRGSQQVI
jgi:hypothetical protein